MKITITLSDTESGHVKFETIPPVSKLLEIAKGEKERITPSVAYAMKAISSLVKDSMEQGQKEGIIPDGIIRPKLGWTPTGHA